MVLEQNGRYQNGFCSFLVPSRGMAKIRWSRLPRPCDYDVIHGNTARNLVLLGHGGQNIPVLGSDASSCHKHAVKKRKTTAFIIAPKVAGTTGLSALVGVDTRLEFRGLRSKDLTRHTYLRYNRRFFQRQDSHLTR
jgi:hypothetical protein